jgi:(p)ppGpp synthase/HD superfamily hydrolase
MSATGPEYLMTMPLHAITEVLGEPGLRDRFQLELRALPPDARATLNDALTLAARLHAEQSRVREPYLNHLLRVAIRIICYYQVTDVEVLVAALLHDSVEDQPWHLVGQPDKVGPPPTERALEVLAQRYGARVATLVSAVTNPEYDPARSSDDQYREHVVEALEHEPWARVIKVSDFTDNGVGLIHTLGPKVPRLATKYRPLVPVFRDLVARPDTPLTEDVKTHIFEQLDRAEERFAAILGDEVPA